MHINLLLLIVPIILLQFGRHKAAHAHKYNMIFTIILALLTSMLLVASILQQLDRGFLDHLTSQSNFAAFVYHFKLVWLGAVPLAIAASAIFRSGRHHH